MKLGILTFHRAHNFGAFLQSYALQETLKSLGHSVSIIDYWPEYFKWDYAPANFCSFAQLRLYKKFRRFGDALLFGRYRVARSAKFQKDIDELLHLQQLDSQSLSKFTDIQNLDLSSYDAIFFGSDQIWNPNVTRGLDRMFWGGFKFDGKKIAYAASVGDDFGVIDSVLELVKFNLKSFSFISVREKNLSIFLQKLGVNALNVLDPTLLLDSQKWGAFADSEKQISESSEKYVLVYDMRQSEALEQIAAAVAKMRGAKVKKIYPGTHLHDLGSMRGAVYSPREFVQLFKNADFVVTTSFHGTAFAINFRKDFYAVNTLKPNYRIESILQQCGILDRYINDESEISSERVKYDESALENLRAASLGFIKNALNSEISESANKTCANTLMIGGGGGNSSLKTKLANTSKIFKFSNSVALDSQIAQLERAV